MTSSDANRQKRMRHDEQNSIRWMKEQFDTDRGRHVYCHRMGTLESVFGDIRDSPRLDEFIPNGKKKVDAQWRLFGIVDGTSSPRFCFFYRFCTHFQLCRTERMSVPKRAIRKG